MLQALERLEALTSSTPREPRPEPDLILRIPYINESFTRRVSSSIKQLGINARVVTQAGKAVRSIISTPSKDEICECELCKADLNCTPRHYVYKAKCKKCGDLYIGAKMKAKFGTSGKSFSGDIAIDDISVKTCLITPLCNDKDFMCLTTPKFVNYTGIFLQKLDRCF